MVARARVGVSRYLTSMLFASLPSNHGPTRRCTWLLRVFGGSWVVISRVISRLTVLITQIRGLLTPLITTHEPPISGASTIDARAWDT